MIKCLLQVIAAQMIAVLGWRFVTDCIRLCIAPHTGVVDFLVLGGLIGAFTWLSFRSLNT